MSKDIKFIKNNTNLISRNIVNTKKRNELGWIYIVSNVSLAGMVKIGQTSNPVEERVQELSQSTSIPTPFKIEAQFIVERPKDTELKIHRYLRKFRINSRKEFFRINLDKAIESCNFCIYGTSNDIDTAFLEMAALLNFSVKYPHRFIKDSIDHEKVKMMTNLLDDWKFKKGYS